MLIEFVDTLFSKFLGIAGNSAIVNNAAVAQQFPNGASTASPSKLLFTVMIWGLSVIVNAWAFIRISSGLFNPAMTMAMMMLRAVPLLDGFPDMAAQLVGATLVGRIPCSLLTVDALARAEMGSQTTVAQGVSIEIFLTSQSVIAVSMLAAETHKETYIVPVEIGLGAAHIGASLTPTCCFDFNVVNGRYQEYHWIYSVETGMGALLADREAGIQDDRLGSKLATNRIRKELIAIKEKNQ